MFAAPLKFYVAYHKIIGRDYLFYSLFFVFFHLSSSAYSCYFFCLGLNVPSLTDYQHFT